MPKNILRLFEYALIAFGVVAIIFLLATQFERILRAWPSEDYFYFRESAQMLVNDISPYARPKLFYPLYTVIWFFVPLLAGDWTRWAWTLAPILFLHIALGRKAVLLLPFYPLLVHLRFGQVDGWLILPVMFLLRDTKTFAPISAALTLLKPQIAWALALYRFAQWARQHLWRNFVLASISAVVLIAPAFILRPDRVRDWLASIAAHPPETNQNATIWGWLYFGTLGIPFALMEGAIAAYLVWCARDRASALHLFGLLVMPILYATITSSSRQRSKHGASARGCSRSRGLRSSLTFSPAAGVARIPSYRSPRLRCARQVKNLIGLKSFPWAVQLAQDAGWKKVHSDA